MRVVLLTTMILAGAAGPLASQDALVPISRAAAVDSALRRGARLGLARADSLLAAAQLRGARAWPNPTLNGSYSKATPNYHLIVDLPLDLPGVRGQRVLAARLGATAARYRIAFGRAAAALDADTTYTRALAARELARLSGRNVRDADSLLRIAGARRAVGDASDLDVELATIAAGQASNVASSDSLAYLSVLLDLQAAMGMTAARVVVSPTDSLVAPIPLETRLPQPQLAAGASARSPANVPLPVAAAQASLQSAIATTRFQRRSLFASPSLTAGFETGDPTGSEPGILPTVGLAIPLPLLDRNRGAIAVARAEEARARAELTVAEVTSSVEIARARRELAMAMARIARDQRMVASADRVATMSLTAYREGAAALPSVLEAQRSARDVLATYVADLADAWIAIAELRVLTLTPAGPP